MSGPISAKTVADKKVSATISNHKPATQKRETSSPFVEASQYLALQPLQLGAETISTYASNCITPQSDFNLGDTVCLKLTGATAGSKRVNWVARTGAVVQSDDITLGVQVFTFTLPTSQSSTVMGTGVDDVTADNRGIWRVYTAAGDNSVRTVSSFTVHAPTPFVDLSTSQSASAQGTSVGAGSSSAFDIYVTNNGPDPAQGVEVVDTLPANTTLVSLGDDSSAFTCGPASGGTVTCTASSLASGTTAKFTLVYEVDSGTPANTVLTNNVAVSSTTAELEPSDNSSTFNSKVPATTGAQTCTLGCRDDMVVAANTSQNGTSGAIVNFTTTTSISGNCGAISSNPTSGSFFPVGTTVVSVVSETGGGSCSFTIKVTETADPTISCPPDKTATADQNGTATVDPGTPTTNPSTGVTVTGLRSDGLDLSDPYPTGVTHITWTVRDSDGRTASCTQRITVTADCAGDTTPPTITAPPNITIGTGADSSSCNVALDDELGQPTADDDCSVTVTTTGIPAGNLFPIGETTITYTATDPAGHTATATQKVTVTDDTLPIIFAPADASYTCMSEVPAANPSQATGPDIIVNGQPQPGPPFDNCGTPTVTVTESSTGAGSAGSPRVITRVYTATDAHGNSASATQTITVTDGTPPTIAAPSNVTLYTGAGATSCGVNVSNLDASLGTASASDNCSGVTTARSGVPSGNNFPVGDTTITYTATDAAGNTASATQKVTVIDNTPPTVTAPADATLYTGAGATSCSVTAGNLDAALGTATIGDNCAGVTVARSGVPAGNVFPIGDTTVTYTATDAHGNTASKTQKVTVVDNTPPTISCPTNITVNLPLNTTATSMAVNYPNPATATDNCAGPINISYSKASGSTFSVGTTTVTVTATDAHGNTASCSFTVTVLYDFTGFFSPVNNLPIFNQVNAGRAIPVKFSLSGNKGLNIFAPNSPSSGVIACDANAQAVDVTETVTAGGSSLSYDASGDQYNYVWKTESSWAGTCRQLVVTLNDGSVHRANFKFK